MSAVTSRCATTTSCSMDARRRAVTDHGVALDIKNVPWAGQQMWAPDAAEKDGKYYLYFPAKDKQDVFRIGVASAARRPARSPRSRSRSRAATASIRRCSRTLTAGLHVLRRHLGRAAPALDVGHLQPEGRVSAERSAGAQREGRAPGRQHDELRRSAARRRASRTRTASRSRAGDNGRRFFEAVMDAQVQRHVLLLVLDRRHALHLYATGKSPYGPFTYRGKCSSPCSAGRITTRSSSSRASGSSSTTTRSSRAARRTCATSR